MVIHICDVSVFFYLIIWLKIKLTTLNLFFIFVFENIYIYIYKQYKIKHGRWELWCWGRGGRDWCQVVLAFLNLLRTNYWTPCCCRVPPVELVKRSKLFIYIFISYNKKILFFSLFLNTRHEFACSKLIVSSCNYLKQISKLSSSINERRLAMK